MCSIYFNLRCCASAINNLMFQVICIGSCYLSCPVALIMYETLPTVQLRTYSLYLVEMPSCWYYICVRWYVTWMYDFFLLKYLTELNPRTLPYLVWIPWLCLQLHIVRYSFLYNLYLIFISYNFEFVLKFSSYYDFNIQVMNQMINMIATYDEYDGW
jgi:hypothetical protein